MLFQTCVRSLLVATFVFLGFISSSVHAADKSELRSAAEALLKNVKAPPGFKVTLFASGLANPRRLLVLPNGDVLVAEQSAGYLTLLRDEGDSKATWINRHVEDLNRPYGLAWRNDHVLVADQDAIWRVPHTLGAVRAAGIHVCFFGIVGTKL